MMRENAAKGKRVYVHLPAAKVTGNRILLRYGGKKDRRRDYPHLPIVAGGSFIIRGPRNERN